MNTECVFYVYAYFRLDGSPCYIGKGKGNRWLQFSWRTYNEKLSILIVACGGRLPAVKIREGLTERQALDTEIALIAAIGRGRLGPLLNKTDGGDGVSGWVPSTLTRQRICVANTGKSMSVEARLKMSEARRGRKKSQEHKDKIAAAHLGVKKPAAACAAMKASHATRKMQVIRNAVYQHARMTPEQKAERSAKISEATKAAMSRPEVRQKLSLAAKARLNMHLNFNGKTRWHR